MYLISDQSFDPLCASRLKMMNAHTINAPPESERPYNYLSCNPCMGTTPAMCCCGCFKYLWPGYEISSGASSSCGIGPGPFPQTRYMLFQQICQQYLLMNSQPCVYSGNTLNNTAFGWSGVNSTLRATVVNNQYIWTLTIVLSNCRSTGFEDSDVGDTTLVYVPESTFNCVQGGRMILASASTTGFCPIPDYPTSLDVVTSPDICVQEVLTCDDLPTLLHFECTTGSIRHRFGPALKYKNFMGDTTEVTAFDGNDFPTKFSAVTHPQVLCQVYSWPQFKFHVDGFAPAFQPPDLDYQLQFQIFPSCHSGWVCLLTIHKHDALGGFQQFGASSAATLLPFFNGCEIPIFFAHDVTVPYPDPMGIPPAVPDLIFKITF